MLASSAEAESACCPSAAWHRLRSKAPRALDMGFTFAGSCRSAWTNSIASAYLQGEDMVDVMHFYRGTSTMVPLAGCVWGVHVPLFEL